MVLEKSLDHLLRGVFKGGNDLFIHCFMNSYCDFFFFSKLLERKLRGLWERRKPRDKQGQWSGYGGDRKTKPGNKYWTNNWDDKTSWIKLLSQVLTWDLFTGNVRNSFRTLTCKQINVSREDALTISTCLRYCSGVNSCLGRILVFLLGTVCF